MNVRDGRGTQTAVFGPSGEMWSALGFCDQDVRAMSRGVRNGILVVAEIRNNPYATYVL